RPDAAGDPEAAERVRVTWLAALADAGAGAGLSAGWFASAGRRCPAPILFRLVEQAGDALPAAPATVAPDADPLLPSAMTVLPDPGAYPARPDWHGDDAALAGITGELLADPGERDLVTRQLDLYVAELDLSIAYDPFRRLRRVWDHAPTRALLRELVADWTGRAESGSLPDMAWGLFRLAKAAEYGYFDLDPGARRPAPDPAGALRRALRGGVLAELGFPPGDPRGMGAGTRVVQHGDHLTWQRGGQAQVFTRDRRLHHLHVPGGRRNERALWHDGTGLLLTERCGDGWRTYRVDGEYGDDLLLTLDPATAGRLPDFPNEAEVTFPGADGPTRIAYARGWITFTAPDGTVTARLSFPPPHDGGAAPMSVYPPDWWARMGFTDVRGSHALRRTTREQAERLLDAALTGRLAVTEALDRLMPDVSHRALRGGVAAVALDAARCLPDVARLSARLGTPLPPGTPPDLRFRPDLPPGRHTARAVALRRLSEILRRAADEPGTERGRLLGTADVPGPAAPFQPVVDRTFGSVADRAFEAARAWTPAHVRMTLLDEMAAVVSAPVGAGDGRWRAVVLRGTDATGQRPNAVGDLWRTPSGAALALEHRNPPHGEVRLLEYSPDGRFTPFEPPGWERVRADPAWRSGGAEWVVGFRRLLAGRGPIAFPPSLAHDLAERTGLWPLAAAEVCFGHLRHYETFPEPIDVFPEEIRVFYTAPDDEGSWGGLPADTERALLRALMPDDPADLWDRGPDVARAAARYREPTENA
uniref:hypothetical protein n=1 Tax=Actinomadura kijaniata TaxID=46161 RepID=UPI000AA779C9